MRSPRAAGTVQCRRARQRATRAVSEGRNGQAFSIRESKGGPSDGEYTRENHGKRCGAQNGFQIGMGEPLVVLKGLRC
jgi:hypothetical protein